MTSLSSELEKRLGRLETEQNNQDNALSKLGDFGAEVSRLETALALIDNYDIKPNTQETDFSNLRDNEETRRLERELLRIDNADAVVGTQCKASLVLEDEDIPILQPTRNVKTAKPQKTAAKPRLEKSTSSATQGYIIALMFNSKSPVEWSGTGWQKQGGGKRYMPEQAKQIYKKLKKQWPNYPLKILKR